jgi:hypothetical protein
MSEDDDWKSIDNHQRPHGGVGPAVRLVLFSRHTRNQSTQGSLQELAPVCEHHWDWKILHDFGADDNVAHKNGAKRNHVRDMRKKVTFSRPGFFEAFAVSRMP